MPGADQTTNDFFKTLTTDEQVVDPFSDSEILVREPSGQIISVGGKEPGGAPAASKPIPKTAAEVKQTVGAEIDAAAGRVLEQARLRLTDDRTRERLVRLITSSLRGVRDQLQTREALLSSPLVGGVGLDTLSADRVLEAIKRELGQLDTTFRQAASVEPFADLQAEAERLLIDGDIPSDERPATLRPLAKPISPVVKTEARPQTSPLVVPAPPAKQPTVPILPTAPPLRRMDDAQRPRVEDVKFSPRLVGPVEEIRSLTVEDFRRLGQNPSEATEKVWQKIALLEDDSFARKMEGIQAWKESEVNRLYLEIGDEAMEGKQGVAEVIAGRTAAAKPTLTEEEFEAVMSLNYQLRY